MECEGGRLSSERSEAKRAASACLWGEGLAWEQSPGRRALLFISGLVSHVFVLLR